MSTDHAHVSRCCLGGAAKPAAGAGCAPTREAAGVVRAALAKTYWVAHSRACFATTSFGNGHDERESADARAPCRAPKTPRALGHYQRTSAQGPSRPKSLMSPRGLSLPDQVAKRLSRNPSATLAGVL